MDNLELPPEFGWINCLWFADHVALHESGYGPDRTLHEVRIPLAIRCESNVEQTGQQAEFASMRPN
jgi:hypothetical protein